MWQISRRQFTSHVTKATICILSFLWFLRKSSPTLEQKLEDGLAPFRHPLTNQPILGHQGELLVLRPGGFAEIRIDEAKGTIVKRYCKNGINCMGESIVMHDESLERRYRAEKSAYLRLADVGSKFLPENLIFNDEERSISMKYYGKDLLTRVHLFGEEIPASIRAQVVPMFEEYRQAGFFKVNFALSNLLVDEANARLVGIGFSEHVNRNSKNLIWEVHLLGSVCSHFPDLAANLQHVYSDFSPDLVRSLTEVAIVRSAPIPEVLPIKERVDLEFADV